ncbi:MAG: hypothetical protein JRJ77_18835 [Deltaproteobacteria bacterium]|nr:hypothetical protein [Deltaproteobacteria bacterium]
MRKITSSAEVQRVLAVVAHPDDESFDLGAVLAELTNIISSNRKSEFKPLMWWAVEDLNL